MKKLLFPFFVALCIQGKSQVFLEQEPDSFQITYEVSGTIADRMVTQFKLQQSPEGEYFEKVAWGEPIFRVGDVENLSQQELKELDEKWFTIRHLKDSVGRNGWWPILLKQNIFSKQEIITRNGFTITLQEKMYGPVAKPELLMTMETGIAFGSMFMAVMIGLLFAKGAHLSEPSAMKKLKWQAGMMAMIAITLTFATWDKYLSRQVWIEVDILCIILVGIYTWAVKWAEGKSE